MIPNPFAWTRAQADRTSVLNRPLLLPKWGEQARGPFDEKLLGKGLTDIAANDEIMQSGCSDTEGESLTAKLSFPEIIPPIATAETAHVLLLYT